MNAIGGKYYFKKTNTNTHKQVKQTHIFHVLQMFIGKQCCIDLGHVLLSGCEADRFAGNN